MKKQLTVCLSTLGLALCMTWTALAEQTDIGTFTTIDVPGSILTRAVSINAHGDVVGNYVG